jgi:hypothetical protein
MTATVFVRLCGAGVRLTMVELDASLMVDIDGMAILGPS